jgi:chemotaxis receptor (MCP) glutamine deamidase CheD
MAETSVKLLQCELATSGLLKIDQIGSGVGVIIYSSSQKTGAGLHILAPRSGSVAARNPLMYADTAIPFAMEQLAKKGVKPPFSVAIAGGAALLKCQTAMGSSQRMIEAVKAALANAALSVKLEETGGTKVRSITLDIDAGKIKIE